MTKIAALQCRMMNKKYTTFEKGSLKDDREKLRTKPDRRTDRLTDGQTDRQVDSSVLPQLLRGGIHIMKCLT